MNFNSERDNHRLSNNRNIKTPQETHDLRESLENFEDPPDCKAPSPDKPYTSRSKSNEGFVDDIPLLDSSSKNYDSDESTIIFEAEKHGAVNQKSKGFEDHPTSKAPLHKQPNIARIESNEESLANAPMFDPYRIKKKHS